MHPALSRLNSTLASPATDSAVAPSLATLHPLEDLAVVQAVGAEAVTFLQGQLTNDIAGAGPDQARLAGYCTAQGRLLATLVAWHGAPCIDDGAPVVHALVRQDILAPLLKRLGMFVMRAKVKLSAAPLQVVGVMIDRSHLETFCKNLGHALPTTPWQALQSETGTWIAAPCTGNLRWWWIAGQEHVASCAALLEQLTVSSPQAWHVQDILAGLPWIEAATQDLFIPQTLNLDLIQGVSFTKGCYPGQEIVARSHYRGTVKRRMALGSTTAAVLPRAGTDLYDGTAPAQPCGRLINAAGAYVLFEAPFDAVEHAALHLGSADGPTVTPQPLPYSTRPA